MDLELTGLIISRLLRSLLPSSASAQLPTMNEQRVASTLQPEKRDADLCCLNLFPAVLPLLLSLQSVLQRLSFLLHSTSLLRSCPAIILPRVAQAIHAKTLIFLVRKNAGTHAPLLPDLQLHQPALQLECGRILILVPAEVRAIAARAGDAARVLDVIRSPVAHHLCLARL